MNRIVLAFLLSFLIGCASLYFPPEPKHPENLSNKDLLTVIQKSPSNKKPALALVEASKRGLIESSEVYLIMDCKLEIGMSEQAMLLMMGIPNSVHKSTDTYGVYKQYRFGSYRHLPTFVYVDGGKVTSWDQVK